jgi:hypothetical protein
VSGKGTIVVNDTSATTPGALSSTPITVAHVTSGNASNFVLGGANVVSTQQGPAIPKGFAQYQLAFDPVTLNYNLVTVIAAPTVEMGNVMEGMQNLWNMTSEGASQRVSAIRHSVASDSDGKTPIPAQAGTFDGYSFWGKAYFGGAAHDHDPEHWRFRLRLALQAIHGAAAKSASTTPAGLPTVRGCSEPCSATASRP